MENKVEETWYVPRRFYRLTSITIYKNTEYTSGFEVTYDPPGEFTGWPSTSYLFGSNAETSQQQTVALTSDLQ